MKYSLTYSKQFQNNNQFLFDIYSVLLFDILTAFVPSKLSDKYINPDVVFADVPIEIFPEFVIDDDDIFVKFPNAEFIVYVDIVDD